MPATTTLPTQSEVPLEQTWALESIFATPTDWEPACRALTAPELVEAAFQVLAGLVDRLEKLVELTFDSIRKSLPAIVRSNEYYDCISLFLRRLTVQHILNILKAWLPIAVVTIGLCGLVYLTVQPAHLAEALQYRPRLLLS